MPQSIKQRITTNAIVLSVGGGIGILLILLLLPQEYRWWPYAVIDIGTGFATLAAIVGLVYIVDFLERNANNLVHVLKELKEVVGLLRQVMVMVSENRSIAQQIAQDVDAEVKRLKDE